MEFDLLVLQDILKAIYNHEFKYFCTFVDGLFVFMIVNWRRELFNGFIMY